jgi:NADH-quinone oxidoreductase subunit N
LAASCVSLYYYLQVLKQVWVTPAGEGQGKVSGGIIVSALLVVLALVVVVTGCVPELLLRLLK